MPGTSTTAISHEDWVDASCELASSYTSQIRGTTKLSVRYDPWGSSSRLRTRAFTWPSVQLTVRTRPSCLRLQFQPERVLRRPPALLHRDHAGTHREI